MIDSEDYIRGRGAQSNPHNSFDRHTYEDWDGMDIPGEIHGKTKYLKVYPKTIINKVASPDVHMDYSLNPYQGCEHGCTYCYARPTHEYWGYSAGIDFERIILVKENAPELLKKALNKKSWKVKPVVLSGNTDCYQPCEQTFGITRRLLEVFLEYRHPVGIITKNVMMQRDLDIIRPLAELNLIAVNLSITTMDENLRRKLEPRTASLKRKLELIEQLSEMQVPVNIMIAPVIPSLNDHEIFSLMKETSQRGAKSAHYQFARLNGPNEGIFKRWLSLNYKDRAGKVIHQLEEIHGGKVSNSVFENRMKGQGVHSLSVKRQYEIARRKFFPDRFEYSLRTDLFRRPDSTGQLNLFE